jgi:hypothetical protein
MLAGSTACSTSAAAVLLQQQKKQAYAANSMQKADPA